MSVIYIIVNYAPACVVFNLMQHVVDLPSDLLMGVITLDLCIPVDLEVVLVFLSLVFLFLKTICF